MEFSLKILLKVFYAPTVDYSIIWVASVVAACETASELSQSAPFIVSLYCNCNAFVIF